MIGAVIDRQYGCATACALIVLATAFLTIVRN
jgi:hypothetical protein